MSINAFYTAVIWLSTWLLCPAAFATSYNNWPELQQWKDEAYQQCNSKHNSGTDAENFYRCQTEKLLQDFPMPAGQDTECAKKTGNNPTDKHFQQNINQCLLSLVSETSKYKKSVAKMLANHPELETELITCQQSFDAGTVPYATKWLQINSCLKKVARKKNQ